MPLTVAAGVDMPVLAVADALGHAGSGDRRRSQRWRWCERGPRPTSIRVRCCHDHSVPNPRQRLRPARALDVLRRCQHGGGERRLGRSVTVCTRSASSTTCAAAPTGSRRSSMPCVPSTEPADCASCAVSRPRSSTPRAPSTCRPTCRRSTTCSSPIISCRDPKGRCIRAMRPSLLARGELTTERGHQRSRRGNGQLARVLRPRHPRPHLQHPAEVRSVGGRGSRCARAPAGSGCASPQGDHRGEREVDVPVAPSRRSPRRRWCAADDEHRRASRGARRPIRLRRPDAWPARSPPLREDVDAAAR